MIAPVDHEESGEPENEHIDDEDQEDNHIDEDAEAEAHNDNGEDEVHHPRGLRDPGQPTQAMIDGHNRTHLPFRPW